MDLLTYVHINYKYNVIYSLDHGAYTWSWLRVMLRLFKWRNGNLQCSAFKYQRQVTEKVKLSDKRWKLVSNCRAHIGKARCSDSAFVKNKKRPQRPGGQTSNEIGNKSNKVYCLLEIDSQRAV